jgi:glutamyl-tRNA reductase
LIFNRLLEYKNLDVSVEKYLYRYDGLAVVNHLFKVAAGLDSMVLGEDQIVGQVKSAFLISELAHCAGPVLTRLFNRSFSAGKKVRTETKISEGSVSVSSAAVTLAKQQYNDIDSRSILLIGAGETGRLSVLSLIEKGCKNIYIINRTLSKAEALARKFNATAIPFSKIKEYLVKCDIVMVATGSTTPLIDGKMIQEVMHETNFRPLTILDLSVPRNVTQDVGNIENVTLYDVDDTLVVIQDTFEKRKAEIIKAEEIISLQSEEYMEWLTSLSLSPTIRHIKENFRRINEIGFNNYLKCNDEVYREMMQEYGTHISDKFSGLIIKNLKELTDNGKKTEHLKMLNELFELTSANDE